MFVIDCMWKLNAAVFLQFSQELKLKKYNEKANIEIVKIIYSELGKNREFYYLCLL